MRLVSNPRNWSDTSVLYSSIGTPTVMLSFPKFRVKLNFIVTTAAPFTEDFTNPLVLSTFMQTFIQWRLESGLNPDGTVKRENEMRNDCKKKLING